MVAVRPTSQFDQLFEQLCALPENLIGEIIENTLLVSPRPSGAHGAATAELTGLLLPPFSRGSGGPGGWRILFEPELHLGTPADVLVPDIAGWRVDRLPQIPAEPYFILAPDWACEVLSPSTERIDRSLKMAAYARHQVRHLWLVDTTEHALEVYRLQGPAWRLVAKHTGDVEVRAEPFEAVSVDLRWLWR